MPLHKNFLKIWANDLVGAELSSMIFSSLGGCLCTTEQSDHLEAHEFVVELGYHGGLPGDPRLLYGVGIRTDRIGLLAAGPDLAGFRSKIRLAEVCRTGTGGFRVKYKAAGICRILPDLAGSCRKI